MKIIKRLSVQNFRCFRATETIDFGAITYLVGPNNAGKSAFLVALRCFFDSSQYDPGFLNQSEFSRRQKGYTQSRLTVTFDLGAVTGKALAGRLASAYGKELAVTKVFNFGERSGAVTEDYLLGDQAQAAPLENLPQDVQQLLRAVSISYIHPQQGAELLAQAREKFKARLFHNWGRHKSVSNQLKDAQTNWKTLRTTANSYLSSALTTALQQVWPEAAASVELPDEIKDIVAISDISFRSSPSLPEISLTSQGTGAQSLILYQTHYLLDSDKSLHQGHYYPIWLLEEPEAFLHADIAVKLGELLASDEWLSTIQIVASTHSPLILAAGRQAGDSAEWVVAEQHAVKKQRSAADVTDEDIAQIGTLMGDPNFDAYFIGSAGKPLIFLEDKRNETKEAFERAGVHVAKALNGIGEVKKYITVFQALPGVLKAKALFLVDHDHGLKEIQGYVQQAIDVEEREGITLKKVTDKIFLILLPKGQAIEEMFKEFKDFVRDCYDEVFDDDHALRKTIPASMARVVGNLQARGIPTTRQATEEIMKSDDEIKNKFWKSVKARDLKPLDRVAAAIKHFSA